MARRKAPARPAPGTAGPASGPAQATAAVHALYALSGFLSLGYQVVWFRIFADRFGSTNLTFLLVLTAFIGGLGAGALASRRLVRRLAGGGGNLLRLYGLVEIGVSVTVIPTLLLRYLPADLWGSFPYHLSPEGFFEPSLPVLAWRLGIAALCVFVPCFLMGVTFPLLCRAFRGAGRFPSALYGANTLGACSGVLACEFVLLPGLGHGRTLGLLLVLNTALGAVFLAGVVRPAATVREKKRDAGPAPGSPLPLGNLVVLGIVSGLLAGALEGDFFKRLRLLGCFSNGTAMSFISFWAIVGIFLASVTVWTFPRLRLGWVKAAWAVAWVYYVVLWNLAYPIREWLAARDLDGLRAAAGLAATGQDAGQYFYFQSSLGILLVFTGLFVFPTMFCTSLLLPHVLNRLQGARAHVGRVYGLNTLAFCAGLVAFTWAAPAINLFYSLKLLLPVFAILTALVLWLRPVEHVEWLKVGAAVIALLLAIAAVPVRFDPSFFPESRAPARHPVRALRSNGAHTTYVVDEPQGKSLYFDAHSMSGTSPQAQQYMRMMAHFPLLAHPDPRRALLLCFGVGTTASAIAAHGTVEAIDVVDLNVNVFRTAPEFSQSHGNVQDDPRLSFIVDDGRHFLDLTDRSYDLVTSEPPPPMHDGVYRLYSAEYYRSVLARLTAHGMMTQWLPVGQMPRDAVARAVHTFTEVFPHTLLFTGYGTEFILLGSRHPLDLRTVERRFPSSGPLLGELRRFGAPTPVHLISRVVQTHRTLRRAYEGARLVSDVHNDFAHLVLNPFLPAVVRYEPRAVLEDLRLDDLASGPALRRTITNLARLKGALLDFPTATLMTVSPGEGIAFAGADWRQVRRLNREALDAIREGRLDLSIVKFRQSLSLVDQQIPILTTLASLLAETGQLDEAIRLLHRAADLEPGDPGIMEALRQARARRAAPRR